MPKQSITIIKIVLAVLCVLSAAVDFTANDCWGAERVAAYETITLDVKNEPLRSVLVKITRKTGWKVKVPDKWLEKPVTQTLSKAKLEDGLRSVLNNAGVENVFLLYDENIKVATLFDTDGVQKQGADHHQAQANTQRPAVESAADADHMLQPPVREARPAPARASRRIRRQAGSDDD